MRKVSILNALLPRSRQGILAATLVQPDKAWYASELARRLRMPSSSVQRDLRDLPKAGLLRNYRQGRMAYYQANSDSPAFSDLRGLLLKTVRLVNVLADDLKPLVAKLRLFFVDGSMASGQELSHSNIDLMVVGRVSPAELALPLRHARELLGRVINPTVYSSTEFDRKRAAKAEIENLRSTVSRSSRDVFVENRTVIP